MSPYHYRLDWLLWFAAMGEPARLPVGGAPGLEAAARRIRRRSACWPAIRSRGAPPRYVRVELYRYRSRRRGAPATGGSARASAPGCRRCLRDNPELQSYLRQQGWLRDR